MLKDRPIILLALGQTLVWAALFYSFPAALLRWETDFGWTKPQLTLAITLGVLASALASPMAGHLIDRGRGAFLMGGSAAVGGAGLLALTQITELWQFFTIWLVIGVCMAGTLYDPCFAIITRARGAGAKRGIVWITLIAGFAGTVAFPTIHILSEAFGWRVAFCILGAITVIVVAPLLYIGANLLPPQITQEAEASTGSRSYLRNPVFWLLGIAFGFAAIAHGAVLQHLLPILNERGAEAGFAVLAASLIGPMQVLGRLGMVFTDRIFSHHQFSVIAFAAMGCSVAVLWIAGTAAPLILLFVALFGSAYGTVSILRPVITRDVLGEANFGAKSGGLSLIYRAATAISAWLGAVVWGWGGYSLMLGLLVALVLLGMGCYAMANVLSEKQK